MKERRRLVAMVSGGRKIQGFVSAGIKEWVWKG
jgi:hypothetical protein